MNWPLLGNIAAIATLISFSLLLLSKLLLIKARKDQIIHEFSFDYLYNQEQSNIYDEVIIDEDTQNGDFFLLSSAPLRSIVFYRIHDDEGNPIKPRMKLHTYKDLPKNQLLQISIRVPEGYPLYEIEAQRDDYVIITKEVSYNGSGYKKYNNPRSRFTFYSYLYYIFS